MTDGTPTPDSPWLLGELSAKLKSYIDQLGTVWVEGEITSWSPRSSGIFGTIKDVDEDTSMGFSVWSSATARIPDDIKVLFLAYPIIDTTIEAAQITILVRLP
mgnify:CR=1 FL=1